MFRFLFLLFLVIPLVEIYFLIQVGQVIGAGEGEIGALADLQVDHAFLQARVIGGDDAEHAGGNALADGIVDAALPRQHAAIGLGDQHPVRV